MSRQIKPRTNKQTVIKVGKVISVRGRLVDVLVHKSKNTTFLSYKGEIIQNVSVGSFIKIHKDFMYIIGRIDDEYITVDKKFEKRTYRSDKEKINRILRVSLIGYFEGLEFKQGIKELPLIDNECILLTKREINSIYNFLESGIKENSYISIGNSTFEKNRKIQLAIDKLFASHIGIFGNTGSGKSYTLSSLYHKLFQNFKGNEYFQNKTKFLFIDFNGEFSGRKCITERKVIYNLSTDPEKIDKCKLPIQESSLIDLEIISVLANATEKTQKPFISRSLKRYKSVDSMNNSLEQFRSLIQQKIRDVILMADKANSHLLLDYIEIILDVQDNKTLQSEVEWNNSNNHFMEKQGASKQLDNNQIEQLNVFEKAKTYEFPKNTIDKLIHFLYLQLIEDVYSDRAKNDHISPAINKLKSHVKDLNEVIECNNNDTIFKKSNIVIINLNDTTLLLKKTIPLVLAKLTYEKQKKDYRKSQEYYLNIVIDEAHNILSDLSKRESESWKDYRLEIFEEIIKEGRKFGAFLTIASQRPTDISNTIISQLHTYFLHRLVNNKDIETIGRTIAYLDKISFEALPIMPTGTCVLTGYSVNFPIVVEIDKINEVYEPDNKTIQISKYWDQKNQKS